jgi:hypothetical protein
MGQRVVIASVLVFVQATDGGDPMDDVAGALDAAVSRVDEFFAYRVGKVEAFDADEADGGAAG